MQVELTHEASKKLGFYCHHIDIDSATHLKRMIELNIERSNCSIASWSSCCKSTETTSPES